MKNNFINKIGYVMTGVIIGSLTISMANQSINALLNEQIKVNLNGRIQEFEDELTMEKQYPITYKDRTYLPLRNVAQISGLNVDYDANSNTALLSTNTISGMYAFKSPKEEYVLSEESSKEIYDKGGEADKTCKLYFYDDNGFYYKENTGWDYMGHYSINGNELELKFEATQGQYESLIGGAQEINTKVILDTSNNNLRVVSTSDFKVHKLNSISSPIAILEAKESDMGFDCLYQGSILNRIK